MSPLFDRKIAVRSRIFSWVFVSREMLSPSIVSKLSSRLSSKHSCRILDGEVRSWGSLSKCVLCFRWLRSRIGSWGPLRDQSCWRKSSDDGARIVVCGGRSKFYECCGGAILWGEWKILWWCTFSDRFLGTGDDSLSNASWRLMSFR